MAAILGGEPYAEWITSTAHVQAKWPDSTVSCFVADDDFYVRLNDGRMITSAMMRPHGARNVACRLTSTAESTTAVTPRRGSLRLLRGEHGGRLLLPAPSWIRHAEVRQDTIELRTFDCWYAGTASKPAPAVKWVRAIERYASCMADNVTDTPRRTLAERLEDARQGRPQGGGGARAR